MGSGATAQRITFGATRGEALAMQQHEQAMIPILQEKGEMELELQKKAFGQQLEQTKELQLLADKFTVNEKQQPIFVPGTPAAKPNYLIYVAMAVGAYFLLRS